MNTVTTQPPTVEDLLDRVESIRPIIEEHAAQSEADSCLADEIYDAFRDAGLHRMLVPGALGGYEMHPSDFLRVMEAVATIDAAASWNLGMANAVLMSAWCAPGLVEEVFADGPDVVGVGVFFPPGGARPEEGGWRVNGRVPFGTGSSRGTWFMIPIVELDAAGEPILDAATGEPSPMAAFFPRADISIEANWDTLGMRGTASDDVVFDDVFVPEHRVAPIVPLSMADSNPAFSGPLYRMTLFTLVHAEAIASIGSAVAAIEKLVALASTKPPASGVPQLKDREFAQHNVARAQGLVGAARSYLHDTISTAYDEAATNGELSIESKLALQLAACNAAEASASAVRLVHEVAGTSGVRAEGGIERHLRDVHTLTQHASKSSARFESVGKVMFGHPVDWLILAL